MPLLWTRIRHNITTHTSTIMMHRATYCNEYSVPPADTPIINPRSAARGAAVSTLF